MEYWFSKLYSQIDAMRMEGFLAGLTPDVEVIVGNNPPMKGHEAVRRGIGQFWASIGGLKHNFENIVESNGLTVLESTVDYLRKDGKPVSVPVVTVLERQGDLVSAMRIYYDISPVYA